MTGPNLDDYNDVPSRIQEFRDKYPEGTLQQIDLQMFEVDGKSYVCYTAAAFRSPEDSRPGMGTAWEPVPGPTKFTRDSEVQNAETSAWGRAIIAVGAADAKKIASREEVRNRVGEDERQEPSNMGLLVTKLVNSGFTKAIQSDIIATAIGRRVRELGELSAEEVDLAIRAIDGAVADREQLEEEE